MTLDEYQERSSITATFERQMKELGLPVWIYPILGLGGESGECLEALKKAIRDGHFTRDADSNIVINEEYRGKILKELGDSLWYLTQTARAFGSSLEEVAELNLVKLLSRKARGVIHGSGDNR